MHEPRAIVFDLDDTLYPYRTFVLSGFEAVGARLAVERDLPAQEVVQFLRRAVTRAERGRELQALCARFSLPVAIVPSLVSAIREHVPSIRLPRASVRVLASLRHSWRVGILTNGAPTVQRRKLEALGVKHLVDEIVCAADCGSGSGKPAPEGFEAVLGQLGSRPEQAVFVGDDVIADIAGAAAVGMKTIHVHRPGIPVAPGCDAHTSNLRDVPAIAERLVPGPAAIAGRCHN